MVAGPHSPLLLWGVLLLLWATCSTQFALKVQNYRGILKEVPSDFLVMEDLSLMHLDSPAMQQQLSAVAEPISDHEKLVLREWLGGIVGVGQLNLVAQIAEEGEGGDSSTTLRIQPAIDKDSRTLLHQRLRAVYPAIESKTDTDKGSDEVTVIQVYLSKSNKKLRRWDGSRPDFLHFTAQKSLLSTSELINELSRAMGLLPSRFSYAGSKDKRATTIQRLSVWRPEKSVPTLIRAKNLDLRCFDIAPSNNKVQVGNLSGNYFCTTLRSRRSIGGSEMGDEDSEAAHEAAARIHVSGCQPFVNFFGPQRFGSPLPINPSVGTYLLSSRYDRAVLLLLLSPSSALEVSAGLTLPVLKSWLEGEGEEGWRRELMGKWRGHSERVRALLLSMQLKRETEFKEQEQEQEEEELELELEGPLEDAALELEGEEGAMGLSSGSISDFQPRDVATAEYDVSSHPLMQRLAMVTALLEGATSVVVPRRTPFELRQLVKGILISMKRSVEVHVSEPLLSTAPSSPSDRFASLDFQQIFMGAYSKQLKLLFVNALQSDMFNAAAKERAERGQLEFAEEGDCVLLAGPAGGPGLGQWDASGVDLTAGSIAWDHEEGEGAVSSSSRKQKERRSPARLHRVTATESRERAYSAEFVVIPLPGMETGPAGRMLPLTDRTPALFQLPGAYRHFLSTARNVGALAVLASSLEVPVPVPSPTDKDDAFSARVAELYAEGRMQTLLVSLLQASSEFAAPPDEGVALRVVFSLPASTYATTYLESLGVVQEA